MSALVIADMTVEEAERVTEQIVGRIDSISENYEAVMALMRDALARNAHAVLGYAAPGAYIKERFGRSLESLGASIRREFVHELSDAGLSTRAIAPVFGVSQKTIVKDMQVIPPVSPAPESPAEPDPEPDTYWSPEESFVGAHPITGEVFDTPTTVTETHTVKTVTGLDGKTYKTPEPREPKPVVTGDAANQVNAEGMSKEIGHALDILSLFENASHRARVLTDWWPLGNGAVPPISRALFNPAQLREIAASLGQLAIEMESTNV